MADVDDETRQYLRILAESTKNSGTAGVARRLFKAADTGSHSDYQQAETIFDSLPIDKRMAIKEFAETEARLTFHLNACPQSSAKPRPSTTKSKPPQSPWTLWSS